MVVSSRLLCFKFLRSRSRVKVPPDPFLQASVKMDHSDIYRENEYLDEDLEEHLGELNRNEHWVLVKEGGQLEEIRRQVETITKLQEAVNSRNPGDSAGIVSSARVTRYGRQKEPEEKQEKEIDFRELSRATKSKVRIDLEKEKFSAKNLFNVRRSKTSLGFESVNARKFLPQTAMQIPSDNDVEAKEARAGGAAHKNNSHTADKAKRTKGYLQQTMSSNRGLRPMTAYGGSHRNQGADDILPPRAKSAVLRTRSRRELELLCRVNPKDEEPDIMPDLQIDWDVVTEKRRRRRLHQLKQEGEQLQVKVHTFLLDLEKFNKKPMSLKASDMREIMQNL